MIALCEPHLRGHEWEYVKECLDTGWVSSVGAYVDRFEREFAARIGTYHAIAVANGTSALHIALLVAGVEPEDEVLVSTLTFIAPANAIRYAGAWPVFMDAESEFGQMDVEKVSQFLRTECVRSGGVWRNRRTGRRIGAILPVHILGHPVAMEPLRALAQEYEILLIEDATESLGAKYKDHPVGHLGDIACFSFNGNKLITSGGGGMIATDNALWAQRAKHLTTQAKCDPVEYIHDAVGYNYRLPNVLAAVGCAQMEQLDSHIAAKRRIAANYAAALASLPGLIPMREAEWAFSVFWMYTVRVEAQTFGMDSRALLKQLHQAGIQTRPLWQPLHCSQPYRQCQAYHCETAERLYRDSLSLPCSVGLTEADQQTVIATLLAQSNRGRRGSRPLVSKSRAA
jgi:perosamine synthetase